MNIESVFFLDDKQTFRKTSFALREHAQHCCASGSSSALPAARCSAACGRMSCSVHVFTTQSSLKDMARLHEVDVRHLWSHRNKLSGKLSYLLLKALSSGGLQLRGLPAPQVLGIMTDLTIQQPVTKTYTGSKIMAKSSA